MKKRTYTNTNIKVKFLMRIYNLIKNLNGEYPLTYIRTKTGGTGHSLGQVKYALDCLIYMGIATKRKTRSGEYYVDEAGRRRKIGYTIVYGLKRK